MLWDHSLGYPLLAWNCPLYIISHGFIPFFQSVFEAIHLIIFLPYLLISFFFFSKTKIKNKYLSFPIFSFLLLLTVATRTKCHRVKVVEIFKFGPKLWTHRQRSRHAASMATNTSRGGYLSWTVTATKTEESDLQKLTFHQQKLHTRRCHTAWSTVGLLQNDNPVVWDHTFPAKC